MTDETIKPFVRGIYDIQKLRIQMGNRLVANYKAKLGQAPGKKESEIDAEGRDMLDTLRKHYALLTEGLVGIPPRSQFAGDEIISSYTELCLVGHYVDLLEAEHQHFARLKTALSDYPIFTEFLEPTKGVGPAIAGIIVSEIDIHRAKYPSSLWAYAGLDVAGDGRGRSRRQEHLVEQQYVDREGEEKTKRGISFNPLLKTKLIGVLGPALLKAGDNKYSQMYRDYKHRLESHPTHQEKTKGHRHNMAIRYMVKQFLVDLHITWRGLEGLPVHNTYQEAKLGHAHNAA